MAPRKSQEGNGLARTFQKELGVHANIRREKWLETRFPEEKLVQSQFLRKKGWVEASLAS
jgi:hypothetical protein